MIGVAIMSVMGCDGDGDGDHDHDHDHASMKVLRQLRVHGNGMARGVPYY